MIVKLLTEHHLEFLSLKGGCRGSSESTLVKMPHCWKSHVVAHIIFVNNCGQCVFCRTFIPHVGQWCLGSENIAVQWNSRTFHVNWLRNFM